jgi:hypothetical protein
MTKKSLFAIVSLALSILSPFFLVIAGLSAAIALLGISAGIYALQKIKKNKNLTGKKLAIAGIIVGVLMLIMALGVSLGGETGSSSEIKEDQQVEETQIQEPEETVIPEAVEKQPLEIELCNLLPEEAVIPTEFLINNATEGEGTCSQSFRQTTAYGTSFNVKLHSCETLSDCSSKYFAFVAEEESKRGYTELETTINCFATRRETTTDTLTKLYCDFEKVVFEETVHESGWFDSYILLTEIPQNVLDKVNSK